VSETKDLYVTASEISEFVYCKRAWWLRSNGKINAVTAEMIRGTEGHNKLLKKADVLQRLKVFAITLILISLFGIVLYLLISKVLWLRL
jgi:CRISPR/Cas system-associated exonuclease Cas4 (RecB family)